MEELRAGVFYTHGRVMDARDLYSLKSYGRAQFILMEEFWAGAIYTHGRVTGGRNIYSWKS